MSLVKYRVHEVAKDFGKSTKEITQILTDYASTPKNHMQVLEDNELSAVFEYLTQHNQVDSLESVYAEAKSAPKAQQPAPAAKPQQGQQGQQQAVKGGNRPPQGQQNQQGQPPKGRPQPASANRPTEASKNGPQAPTTREPEKKVVDTRKGGTVNLEKYDERLENLAPERAQKMQTGKQKFQNRNNQRKGPNFGNKRRQEEQEKMRRLQLEIAKKTPLTVKIPDEIGVGELASRMKKTGAEVVKQLMKLGVMASLSEIIDYDTAPW